MTDRSLSSFAVEIHATAKAKGWWDTDRNFGEQIALMHSELSEALEEWRINGYNKKIYFKHSDTCEKAAKAEFRFEVNSLVADCPSCGITKPEGIGIELADCMIRILDTLEHLGINAEDVLALKMRYNGTRPYRHGGKLA